MDEQEFKDRIDGLVNDYDNGIIDGKQLRNGIMDVIIIICSSHLEPAVPPSSTITTVPMLREVVESIKKVKPLNDFREVVLGYNKRNDKHPLKHDVYGFSTVFKALDNRAIELGFNKFQFGYCDPKKQ